MKKHLFILCISLLCINLSFAQEAGKWRGGLESGILHPRKGTFGFSEAAEVKYNLQDNMNIGFKTEFSNSWKKATNFWGSEGYTAVLLSFSVAYDYYFHYIDRQFSPFIGVGLGYYYCKAERDLYFYYSRFYHLRIGYEGNNPTGFIRIGFEIGKFRTTIAYNMIRNPVGFITNMDNVSLSIGFYIGGGKWKKDE